MSENILIPLNFLDLENSKMIRLANAELNVSSEFIDVYDKIIKSQYPNYQIPKFSLCTPKVENEKPRRTLDRILEIFKLFKEGLVLSNFIVYGEFSDIDKLKFDFLPHYTHYVDGNRSPPGYIISSNEEKPFIGFWSEFKDLPFENFAVYKFHLADFEPFSKDTMTNYVESLEYLFVPDSSDGEIAYKFRTRGTLILGRDKNMDERKKIYKNLHNSYNLRSAIVHGNIEKEKKLLNGKNWEDFHSFLRIYVRESIKFFFRKNCLDDNQKRKELIENMTIFKCNIEK